MLIRRWGLPVMVGLCLAVLLGGCVTPMLLPLAAITFNPGYVLVVAISK